MHRHCFGSKAAAQGDPRAQRDLAFMYERGLGADHDAAQVAALNRKAAEKGDSRAQLRLAQALESGDGAGKPFFTIEPRRRKLYLLLCCFQEPL